MGGMSEGLPFELEPAQQRRAPRLRGVVVVRDDDDALIDALLADLFIHAGNCVRVFGDFHFAVSGEPAIEPVLRRLLFDLNYREFPWARTRVWITHDFSVPLDDCRRLWPVLHGLIVEQSGIPPEQAHPIEAEHADAAPRYEATLREHLGWRTKGHDRLDFVLMPLGVQGEIGVVRWPADEPNGVLCVSRENDGLGVCTGLSAGFVNASRVVAVYAASAAVRPAVESLVANLARPRNERSPMPGLALAPAGGELRWYLTRDACPPAQDGA